jgi:hypothetical protein
MTHASRNFFVLSVFCVFTLVDMAKSAGLSEFSYSRLHINSKKDNKRLNSPLIWREVALRTLVLRSINIGRG